jgi:hypothetical protein
MAITIKGIRIDIVSIKRSEETGGADIDSAQYSLISSTEHVLARQSIGSYGGFTLKPSPNTKKLLDSFMESYKADVVAVLGLTD